MYKTHLTVQTLATGAAGTTSEGRLVLEGASSLAIFSNDTDWMLLVTYAIVTAFQ